MPRDSTASHRVRIIGGRWKRTPLPVPDVPGLRPTPDRVRETLFNWLGQDLDGWRCLDLFAGTGALSFEAASRGAQQVICVERDRTACDAIRRSVAKLAAHAIDVRQADAEPTARALAARGERFDLVLLDPPFHQQWIERVLPLAASLVRAAGAIYVESESALGEAVFAPLGLAVHRQAAAGQVHYHLLHKRAD